MRYRRWLALTVHKYWWSCISIMLYIRSTGMLGPLFTSAWIPSVHDEPCWQLTDWLAATERIKKISPPPPSIHPSCERTVHLPPSPIHRVRTVQGYERYLLKYGKVLHAAHGFLLRVKYQLCGMYGRLPGFDLQGQGYIHEKCQPFFITCLTLCFGTRRKISLIDVNAKCRHLKKLTSKGTLRQMCIRVYRLGHVGIFNSALWSVISPVAPLLSGSTHPPPSSSFPVWISILYTRIQCVRGSMGFWASDR